MQTNTPNCISFSTFNAVTLSCKLWISNEVPLTWNIIFSWQHLCCILLENWSMDNIYFYSIISWNWIQNVAFGTFITCSDIAHKKTPVYNSHLFGGNYTAALISSVREPVRETAVGVFHSYLLCSFPFPLHLSLLLGPPSSSGWVAATSIDSKTLAPSHAGSPFHSTEHSLTITRAVFALCSSSFPSCLK